MEANTTTIYDRLKELVQSEKMRLEFGAKARKFVESHFDPKKNTVALIEYLERL